VKKNFQKMPKTGEPGEDEKGAQGTKRNGIGSISTANKKKEKRKAAKDSFAKRKTTDHNKSRKRGGVNRKSKKKKRIWKTCPKRNQPSARVSIKPERDRKTHGV